MFVAASMAASGAGVACLYSVPDLASNGTTLRQEGGVGVGGGGSCGDGCTVFASGQTRPTSIVIPTGAPTKIYWANTALDGAVVSCDRASCTTPKVEKTANQPSSLTTGLLYLDNIGVVREVSPAITATDDSACLSIRRMNAFADMPNSGRMALLYDDLEAVISECNNRTTPKSVGTGVTAIHSTGIPLWVHERDGGTLSEKAKETSPTVLATGVADLQTLISDGGMLYFATTGASGNVYSTSDAIPQTPKLLSGPHDQPWGIAVLQGNVYFTTKGGGEVIRVATDTGVKTTLASGLSEPQGIAVDDGFVYVAETGAGRILKIKR